MSRRERSKQHNRARIIQAARDILEAQGPQALSMRAVADAADVSPGTPYNLFGSKNELLATIANEDVGEFLAKFETRASDNSLMRLLDLVRLAKEHFAGSAQLESVMLGLITSAGDKHVRTVVSAERFGLVESAVAQAHHDGYILEWIDVGALTSVLMHIFVSTALGWVMGDISLEEMEMRILYGFAITLRGACGEEASETLAQVIREMQSTAR